MKRPPSRRLPLVLVGSTVATLTLWAAPASAQTRWVVDAPTSLAWWQVSPNLNHLWATTCAADPSWRPGEGRSSGWTMNIPSRSTTGFNNTEDTVHVPLYPRRKVRHLCAEAVSGEVVADTTGWGAVRGKFTVRTDALTTGEAMRDALMHQVLESARYPDIVFTVDSVVAVTRSADTLTASAVGSLVVRDQPTPLTAAIKMFPDSGSERVLARFRIPAAELDKFVPGLRHLSLGMDTRVWKDFFMGVDLVLHPAAKPGS
jgi:hypothetical protein